MPVSSVAPYPNIQVQTYKNYGSDNAQTFDDILRKQHGIVNNKNSKIMTLASADELQPGRSKYLKIGQISAQKTNTTPDIPVNQETKELFWENEPVAKNRSRFARIQSHLGGMLKDQTANILLGTLSKTHPTVSHVVRNNENIKGFHWDIIHARINKNKPYSTVSEGTSISINPKTLELIFKEPQRREEKHIPIIKKTQIAPAEKELSRTDLLKIRLQKMAQNNNEPFVLGTLSKDLPTVSQVVKNNEHTQDLYKTIVYSDANRNKPYQNLQPGTKICINPVTLELIFEEPLTEKVRKGAPTEACPDKPCTGLSKDERLRQYIAGLEPDDNKLIKIGTLSKDLPTISQVLNKDQRFAGYHWGIILSDINRGKPFNSLSPGTEVSINPENLELLFNVSASSGETIRASLLKEPAAPLQPATIESARIEKHVLKEEKAFQTKPDPVAEKTQLIQDPAPLSNYQRTRKENEGVSFADKLASSAKQMIGKFSDEVDNYEMLLTGLQSQGIEYEGKEGLKENLGQLASLMWLDESALQNFKGIIKIAGQTVYSETIVENASKEQLTNFTNKMMYYLEDGQVITMSTPTVDQSGIVSNRQNEWTLINSNTKENELGFLTVDKKMVNEETINQRISDLQSRASLNNERLTVTISTLEEKILRNVDTLVEMKKERMGLNRQFPRPVTTP